MPPISLAEYTPSCCQTISVMLEIMNKDLFYGKAHNILKIEVNNIVFTVAQKDNCCVEFYWYTRLIIKSNSNFPKRSSANSQRFRALGQPVCPTTTLKVMNLVVAQLLKPKIIWQSSVHNVQLHTVHTFAVCWRKWGRVECNYGWVLRV